MLSILQHKELQQHAEVEESLNLTCKLRVWAVSFRIGSGVWESGMYGILKPVPAFVIVAKGFSRVRFVPFVHDGRLPLSEGTCVNIMGVMEKGLEAVKHVCNRDRMFQARHQLQHIDRSCLNDAFVRSKGHQFSTRMLTSECMAWKKGCTWYPPNSISGMNPCKLSNHANYQCKLFTPRGHLSIDLFGNFRRGGVPSVPQILQVTHGWSCWPTKEVLYTKA
eukprot:1147689-Pelagomonas_calceolata.AAC.3